MSLDERLRRLERAAFVGSLYTVSHHPGDQEKLDISILDRARKRIGACAFCGELDASNAHFKIVVHPECGGQMVGLAFKIKRPK